MTIEDETTEKDTLGPLNGETAIIEFRVDKWKFDRRVRLYNTEQIEELESECKDLSFYLYHGYCYSEKVRPDESWTIDGFKIKKYFNLKI